MLLYSFPMWKWRKKEDEYTLTNSDDLPSQLNWIYADRDTYKAKYVSETRDTGAQHWSMESYADWWESKVGWWEGTFSSGEEWKNTWASFVDVDDDELEEKILLDVNSMENELTRKEMRIGYLDKPLSKPRSTVRSSNIPLKFELTLQDPWWIVF